MDIETPTKQRIQLNSLNHSEQQALAKTTYKKLSYFEKLFSSDRIEFDCRKFSNALRDDIQRLLIQKNIIKKPILLEKLHEYLPEELYAYNFVDGVNKVSAYFYDADSKFMEIYHEFVMFIRESIIQEPFWFQAIPTIRIHCPNAKNANLYPRYHSDICYGHPPEEINFWLPLTDILEGHGFRAMTLENSKKVLEKFDYDFLKFIENTTHDRNFSSYCDSIADPVLTEFGKIALFDSRCVHSGEALKAHTRISIDIRILPLSQYQTMQIEYQGSGRQKIIFSPGNCYHKNNSDELLV